MFTFLPVLLVRYMRALFFAAVGVAALLIVFVSRAYAQAEPADPTSITVVLNWLAVGGSALVATRLISWVSANVAAFNALPPAAKQLIQYALSGVVGLGAVAIINNVPAETMALYQPYFAAFILAVGGIQANQEWHANVNRVLKKP